MPLKRLENSYRVMTWRGAEFWMADDRKPCVLQDQPRSTAGVRPSVLTSTELTTRCEVYQDLLEQVASDAFDARPASAMRLSAGVGMTPPNVLGAAKPTSSVMISKMLGAPFGSTTWGCE